jgi:hypothetical protein
MMINRATLNEYREALTARLAGVSDAMSDRQRRMTIRFGKGLALTCLFAAPIFVICFGSAIAGLAALAATGAMAFLSRVQINNITVSLFGFAAVICLLTLGGNLSNAQMKFQTSGCVYAINHTRFGIVRALDDPRIDPSERAWAETAYRKIAADWPKDLPLIEVATVANVIENAPLASWELTWGGQRKITDMSLYQIKKAYAAQIFDDRLACALYDRGDLTSRAVYESPSVEKIVRSTDVAADAIARALEQTFENHPS